MLTYLIVDNIQTQLNLHHKTNIFISFYIQNGTVEVTIRTRKIQGAKMAQLSQQSCISFAILSSKCHL